jgi:hypothetical protein
MYYIYHIPGVKIGTSINPKRRVRSQGYTEYKILEVHTDIKVASERERELQIEYGYKVDTISYTRTTALRLLHTDETREKIIKSLIGRKITLETRQKTSIALKGKRKPPGSNSGKKNPKYGKGRVYIETTSGFKGTCYDMKQEYPGWHTDIANRKSIRKNSLYPNLNWEIFND